MSCNTNGVDVHVLALLRRLRAAADVQEFFEMVRQQAVRAGREDGGEAERARRQRCRLSACANWRRARRPAGPTSRRRWSRPGRSRNIDEAFSALHRLRRAGLLSQDAALAEGGDRLHPPPRRHRGGRAPGHLPQRRRARTRPSRPAPTASKSGTRTTATATSTTTREVATKNGLLMTGGSDCHGGRKQGRVFLGSVTVPYKCLQAIKDLRAKRCG